MISVDVCNKCRKKICDSGTNFWSTGEDYLLELLNVDQLVCAMPGDYYIMGPKTKVPERCPYKFEHAVAAGIIKNAK